MNMHKNTRLTPYHREDIWRLYNKEKMTVKSNILRTSSLVNFYNTVKFHKGLNDKTPYEILHFQFNQEA